jgi:glycosyltransferase involved in cell wall biosynthesis
VKRLLELSILMPCLNEAETIGRCVDRARESIARLDLRAEVLVADNGSSDGSQKIAVAHGAKVVIVDAPRLWCCDTWRSRGVVESLHHHGRRRREL